MKKIYSIVLMFAWSCNYIFAQHYSSFFHKNFNHHINIQGVFNPASNIGIDYSNSSFKIGNQKITFRSSLILPLFSQKGFDIAAQIGIMHQVNFKDNLWLTSSLKYAGFRNEDINARYFSHGINIRLYPGIYHKNWILAVHLGIDYLPFVNIKHKSYPKSFFEDLYPSETFLSGPQDGWFTQKLLVNQMGLMGAYRKQKWNVNFTIDYRSFLGIKMPQSIPELGMMPFSIQLGFGHIIGRSYEN